MTGVQTCALPISDCEELSGGYSQEMVDYLSKQISAVGGIALVACSLSGEGLLSKGAIFTSLFSSNEPDENLDALFEDL